MKKTSKRTSGSPAPSRKPPRRTRPRATLDDAIAAFAEVARCNEIRWYVFGAQAVALYGVPRLTDDLDITLDLGQRSFAAIARDLKVAGFSPRIKLDGFVEETRIYPVRHDASGWNVDLVLAGPGIEEIFLRDARQIPLSGLIIPVIAPHHLAALKILAGRPNDLQDVRGLIRVAELDHARVEETLALLEQALDQSDLRPLYDRLRKEAAPPSRAVRARVRRARKSPER